MKDYRVFLKDGDYKDESGVVSFEIENDGKNQTLVLYFDHGYKCPYDMSDVYAVTLLGETK